MSRMDDRLDREAERFDQRPINTTAKWGCIGLVVIVLLAIGLGIFSLAGGWASGAKETVSFDNSKQQTTLLIQAEEEMIATAGNVCDTQGTDGEKSEGDPTLVGGDASFQFKATYRKIKADYDRRIRNAYEGKFAPKFQGDTLPRVAPTLEERVAELCP